MKLLVTGSSGLIGSEVCRYFSRLGYEIHGVDNNQRKKLFGESGDTSKITKKLKNSIQDFNHHSCDIRERDKILDLFKEIKPNAIIHTAAQPSHDLAAKIPFDDFEINAVGTLNILEAARNYCPDSPLIHMSTNKVYGDRPNTIKLKEHKTRWDYDDDNYKDGIDENFPIDHSKHSIYGASKLSADILVQEYGRYFNMPTCCLRGGCLTGPNHSGVELHGFLSYLLKCNAKNKKFKVFGYKGKQVRDNIHSEDVVSFMKLFIDNPKSGAVYNIGGGKGNSISILESFSLAESLSGKKMIYEILDENRQGDHIVYYSNLNKIKKDYPAWTVTKGIENIFSEIINNWLLSNE